MDIRQLHYFRTIIEEGQITRAAKVLNIAQPPLSQQLKLLEQELGTTLIIRDAKQWEITESGKSLYRRAVELLDLTEETKREIKEFGDGLRGTLSIGTSSICLSLLPDRIKTFQNRYPELYLKLLLGDFSFLEDLLDKREIEVALLLVPVNSKKVNTLRLPKEPFVIVIPSDWNNSFPEGSVSLRDIIHHPFLMLRRIKGKGMYEDILEKFSEYGLFPKVTLECPDISTLLALVASGVGLTIIPRLSIHLAYNDKITILHIQEPFLEKEPVVVWGKDRYLSRAAERFLQTFKE